MKTFKTKKTQRTTYIYCDTNGRKVAELIPGENGVTEEFIAFLHSEDDSVHNADKRDANHGLLHIEQMGSDGGDYAADKQTSLADDNSNPEVILINTFEAAEKSEAFKAVWDRLTDGQRDLAIKKLQGRSNRDIAAEEGCTEQAIHNRLKKVQKHFEKFR
jgi:DNA-directed RNA polymerase specialized sigma24 family protein